jgi:hypothetical protein
MAIAVGSLPTLLKARKCAAWSSAEPQAAPPPASWSAWRVRSVLLVLWACRCTT